MELHGEVSPQELRNDRWRAIRARVAKACAELTEPYLNDNGAARTDADASMSGWELLSLKCYSKDGMNYVRVRALSSIPTFVGLDTHNYSLQRDDVLFIPYANAQVLYARGLVVLAGQFVESTSGDNTHRLHEEDESSVIFDTH
ncbi:MAG: hypothetical protein ACXVIA_03225 [Halobacteriota archaeon]